MAKDIFNTRDITQPKDGLVVRMNCYWACVDGDPTKALFYGKAPQCNRHHAIMVGFNKPDGLYKGRKAQIIHVPIAYIPPRD